MQNAFRILKPIQKSSKCVWVFRNTGGNAFAKNQTRLAYEDKRDLYCMTYYMCFIETCVITCTIQKMQPIKNSITLIRPLMVIQGQRS